MPDPIIQFSNFIKKWQSIVAMIVGVMSVGAIGVVGWQEVKADTEAMRQRIILVEKALERQQGERDMLIRIDENVKAMNERLKRIEAKQ
jgi:hypothetical protein